MGAFLRALWGGVSLACIATAAPAVDVSYTYDALGRLVRVDYAGGSSVIYNYDAAGNRITVVTGSVNSAPTPSNDIFTVSAGFTKTIDPRVNDTDPDYDNLTITAVGTASHGTATLNGDQTVTYAPTSGYPTGTSGTDSFTYTVSDAHGHSVNATVAPTVTNTAPHAYNDTAATAFNTFKNVLVLANDNDPNGDTITVTGVGSPVAAAHGTTTITGSGTKVKYTPTTGYSGSDSFSYTIGDGHTNTATATVSITVSPANAAPDAVDDVAYFAATTTSGHPASPIITLDPRAGTGADGDPDGDPLEITAVGTPTSGHASVSITGTIAHPGTGVQYTYTGTYMNLHTSDTFTYTISDGQGHTDTATVYVTIIIDLEDGE